MFINTFKKSLPYLMRSNIASLVWGHHGIGKSQTVAQFCQENGYMFVDLRLGTQEVGDLLGLADFEVNEHGEKIATKFMSPDWLVNVINFCQNNPDSWAIIFLDELNRARRDVLQAVFQLVLDKRMHTCQLPKNCYVMAASNPNTSDYIVADIGDKAFLDRFCHVKLEPSLKEWLDFAEKRNFDNGIIQFIQEQPEMLSSKLEDFGLDDVKPSRRSWEAVQKLMAVKTPIEVLQELCFGLVGHAATIAFMESLKNTEKPFSAEDILENYSKIKSKVKKFADNKSGGRIDLLKHSSDNLVKFVTNKKKLGKAQEKNLSEFIKDIPADVAFAVCRELYLEDCCRPMMDADDELKKILRRAKTGTSEAK